MWKEKEKIISKEMFHSTRYFSSFCCIFVGFFLFLFFFNHKMEEVRYMECKVIANGNSQLAVQVLLFNIAKISLNSTVLVCRQMFHGLLLRKSKLYYGGHWWCWPYPRAYNSCYTPHIESTESVFRLMEVLFWCLVGTSRTSRAEGSPSKSNSKRMGLTSSAEGVLNFCSL